MTKLLSHRTPYPLCVFVLLLVNGVSANAQERASAQLQNSGDLAVRKPVGQAAGLGISAMNRKEHAGTYHPRRTQPQTASSAGESTGAVRIRERETDLNSPRGVRACQKEIGLSGTHDAPIRKKEFGSSGADCKPTQGDTRTEQNFAGAAAGLSISAMIREEHAGMHHPRQQQPQACASAGESTGTTRACQKEIGLLDTKAVPIRQREIGLSGAQGYRGGISATEKAFLKNSLTLRQR